MGVETGDKHGKQGNIQNGGGRVQCKNPRQAWGAE